MKRNALLRARGHAAAFVSYGVPRRHVPPAKTRRNWPCLKSVMRKRTNLNQLTWKPQSESGVKPMRGLDGDGKAGGPNEMDGRASARPRTCSRLR